LVELLIFIVIVGVAVAGVLSVLTFGTLHSSDPLRRKQALMLAEGLLEEVELAQFTYCEPNSSNSDTAGSVANCATPELWGKDAGDSSRPYDNVNDYAAPNNHPFDDANGNLVDAAGNSMGLSGYSASLIVEPADLNGIAGGTTADPSVLHIAVTVNYDAGKSVTLDGYRTRYAPRVQ
jgi:MSHA pilin protein MshD